MLMLVIVLLALPFARDTGLETPMLVRFLFAQRTSLLDQLGDDCQYLQKQKGWLVYLLLRTTQACSPRWVNR